MKTFQFFQITTLTLSLGLALVACSNDPKEKANGEAGTEATQQGDQSEQVDVAPKTFSAEELSGTYAWSSKVAAINVGFMNLKQAGSDVTGQIRIIPFNVEKGKKPDIKVFDLTGKNENKKFTFNVTVEGKAIVGEGAISEDGTTITGTVKEEGKEAVEFRTRRS